MACFQMKLKKRKSFHHKHQCQWLSTTPIFYKGSSILFEEINHVDKGSSTSFEEINHVDKSYRSVKEDNSTFTIVSQSRYD